MYSVIVVDDDKETLELLGKEIDWQKLNCRLDGMAQTMEEGLFLVEEKHQRIPYLTDKWMSNCFLTPSHSRVTVPTSRRKTTSVFGGGML